MCLVKRCLERGRDFCSEYHVSRLHQDVWPRVPARGPCGHPAATEDEMVVEGAATERQVWGRRLIPRISMERGVLDLFPPCAGRRRTPRTPRNAVG